MKKYPYIGKALSTTVLFTSKNTATYLEGILNQSFGKLYHLSESEFKDITSEYLTNTKIKIESPEHSEFVQQLAFNGGFAWRGGVSECRHTDKPFLFFSDSSGVTWGDSASDFIMSDKKEIKIPLPKQPKGAPQMPEKPIYTQEMKDNGELPPVGYEFDGYMVKINEPDSDGDLVVIDNFGEYQIMPLSEVPTTKTRYEINLDALTKEIINLAREASTPRGIANAIINGKISGLTYTPEGE